MLNHIDETLWHIRYFVQSPKILTLKIHICYFEIWRICCSFVRCAHILSANNLKTVTQKSDNNRFWYIHNHVLVRLGEICSIAVQYTLSHLTKREDHFFRNTSNLRDSVIQFDQRRKLLLFIVCDDSQS
jgi:hypothetical protein